MNKYSVNYDKYTLDLANKAYDALVRFAPKDTHHGNWVIIRISRISPSITRSLTWINANMPKEIKIFDNSTITNTIILYDETEQVLKQIILEHS